MADEQLTPRICMLMAQVEEGQEGDFGRVREWLARAVSAHRDPVWTADGQVSDSWKPTSPVTGKLDAFEWKVPVQELADYDRPLIDADSGAQETEESEELALLPAQTKDAEGKPVATEVADDKIEVLAPEGKSNSLDVAADEASSADVESKEEPISVADSVAGDEEEKAASNGEAEEVSEAKDEVDASSSAEKAEQQEVEFAMPHAPDDPGPKKKEVPNSPEKAFSFVLTGRIVEMRETRT